MAMARWERCYQPPCPRLALAERGGEAVTYQDPSPALAQHPTSQRGDGWNEDVRAKNHGQCHDDKQVKIVPSGADGLPGCMAPRFIFQIIYLSADAPDLKQFLLQLGCCSQAVATHYQPVHCTLKILPEPSKERWSREAVQPWVAQGRASAAEVPVLQQAVDSHYKQIRLIKHNPAVNPL